MSRAHRHLPPVLPLLLLATPMLLAPSLLAQEAAATPESVGSFEVRFAPEAFDAPYTGLLFVAFSSDGEPRQAMHGWFNAPPVLRFEVEGVEPGASVVLTPAEAAACHPTDWSTVEVKPWNVQAVARLSRTGRSAGLDAGDVYGAPVERVLAPDAPGRVLLVLDRVVEDEPFEESARIRLFEHRSDALSKFHGFDYVLRAGVRLPKDWQEGESYPVVYVVTGFGGTYESIRGWDRRVPEGSPLDRCLVVVPDATNRYGHSVFCDSRSIGPWGEALVRELAPALEAAFGGAGAEHRYVTGVSSGGWSSLWLQVAYPDDFAGCWSHCPDPIDFHDFQQIDLYDPLPDGTPRNMYVDESGQPRPLARRGGQVMLTYEDFVRRENVLNPGGQIRSFEATFSKPLPDGTPRRVFDLETGAIDHAAAAEWKPYDISNRLLTGWDELRDSLAGKIRLYAGGEDTFYLEGAVERFQALAAEAGLLDEMVVEVVPGMAHTLYGAGYEDMQATIEARWAELGPVPAGAGIPGRTE